MPAIKKSDNFREDKDDSVVQQIDHICLLVNDLEETKDYLESLFNLEIRRKTGTENILLCENRHLHFFIKQKDLPADFLSEQHLSLTVKSIEVIKNKLKRFKIKFETGEFSEFQYNNYKWIEWRDKNGIRFECIEKM